MCKGNNKPKVTALETLVDWEQKRNWPDDASVNLFLDGKPEDFSLEIGREIRTSSAFMRTQCLTKVNKESEPTTLN